MLSNKRQITDIFKFAAALLVVNGHLFMYYSGQSKIVSWVNIGAQCVSLFLFFSAYGLTSAYERKGEDYLKGFLKKRIGRILVPLLTAYAVSLPVYAIFKGPIDLGKVVSTLSWGGPYLKFSWYVTEITVLYILFYLCAKISKTSIALASSLSVAVLVLMAILFVTRQPVWYINGLPCFVLGLLFQRFERRISPFISKYGWPLVAALLPAFLVLFQWHYIKDILPALSA